MTTTERATRAPATEAQVKTKTKKPKVWPWIVPIAVLLLVVLVYPMVEIIRLSFTDSSLVSGEPYKYTLDSYRSIFRGDDFRTTLWITAIFVLASTFFQILLGFSAALLVNGAERRGMRGTVITRTVVLTAWAVPGVIIGVIWSLLYVESPSGILNYGMSLVGFSGSTPFLSDPDLALASVTVANIWRGTALSMILCYAGLKTIPAELYEAAIVDGSNAWQSLRNITIPIMKPILMTTAVLVVVETFNTFDMVLSLTGGGPGNSTQVLALGVYDQIFRQLNVGRGAAIAVVLMVINLVMIFFYLRLVEREEKVN